jgi:hypothetical protein
MDNEILSINGQGPYMPLVRKFVITSFRGLSTGNTRDTMEAVFDAVMGTGKVRYGPKPSPESQVSIRGVIMDAINNGLPLRILVPWGSRKPDGTLPDVAEVMALKSLDALHERIKAAYTPGAVFNIRPENASGPYLYYFRAEEVRKEIAAYQESFGNLPKILGVHEFVRMRPELDKVTEEKFAHAADAHEGYIERYINRTDNIDPSLWAATSEAEMLRSIGFHGSIPMEQREFYRERYRRWTPELNPTNQLARYLAAALVRVKLGVTGKDDDWGDNYLKLSFSPPVPGVAATNTLFWRTIPADVTKFHGSAWRNKGYLRMYGEEARPGLIGLEAAKSMEFLWNSITLERCGLKSTVSADYTIEE